MEIWNLSFKMMVTMMILYKYGSVEEGTQERLNRKGREHSGIMMTGRTVDMKVNRYNRLVK